MDDDRWTIRPSDDSGSGTALSDVIKLTVVLIAVLILSLGIVGCTLFFIWMCFLHPDVAPAVMSGLITGGSAVLTAWAGKKAAAKVLKKDDMEVKKEE